MFKLILAAALLCAPPAHAIDQRCFGGGRYQAMSDADASGQGTGHACDASHLNEPRLPPGADCETIRAKVAAHGRRLARSWAALHGYSKDDIREAEKCLK